MKIAITKRYTKCTAAAAFAGLIMISISCAPKLIKSGADQQIKGLLLTTLFPEYRQDTVADRWVIEAYDSSFSRIFFYDGITLVQESYQCNDMVKVSLKDDSTSPVFHTCYHSFAFSDSADKGVYFVSNDTREATLIDKDSAFKRLRPFHYDRSEILDSSNTSLIFSTPGENGDLLEKYSLVGKKDTSLKGSVTVLFSKTRLRDFNYSFAPRLEHRRNMKVISMHTVTVGRTLPESGVYIGPAEIPIELRELEISNEAELKAMFGKARTMLDPKKEDVTGH